MDNKFKIGDRVRVRSGFNGKGISNKEGKVICLDNDDPVCSVAVEFDEFMGGHNCNWKGTFGKDGHCWWVRLNDIECINESKIMSKITDKFTLAFKKEPEKSFRLAGVTNGDDFLTDDGQKIFVAWLLKKHGDDFKKEVVDDLLKEESKS